MQISEVEKFIKSIKKEQITISPRIEEKLKERKLDVEDIKNKILNNYIVGIVSQGEDVYKIWLEDSKHYDLNIILRIKGSMCYLVSAFPCESNRRIKHEKTKREKG
jgi:hypothetical protein